MEFTVSVKQKAPKRKNYSFVINSKDLPKVKSYLDSLHKSHEKQKLREAKRHQIQFIEDLSVKKGSGKMINTLRRIAKLIKS